ncbi:MULTISPECIES: ABC transporter ATP-binding protein [Terrabacteria group]|uniref:ABC transporter ATP-binding protein n=1 Tax=Bacillati TaxID=1783272 RepID=UPI001C6F2205|nr:MULTISPECIES: ABC transporter ATP-binding protein [Terrabacteria group]MBW9212730.1 ABC transporter ATP-binding protein/permease [Trueperella sp. zg.1013]
MSEQTKTTHLKYFGISRIWPYIRMHKKRMLAMIALGTISSIADSIFPLFNRYAINHFVALRTMDTVVIFVLLYLFCMLMRVLSDRQSTFLAAKMELEVNRDLRSASFNHLQNLSFSYFNQNNVGYIHSRVISDTGRIGEMFSWVMIDIVWQFTYIVFVLVNMVVLNIQLAFWVILLVPIAVLVVTFFQKRLILQNQRVRELNSIITSDLNEGITGAKSIKTMVIEEEMSKDFQGDIDKMYRESIRTARYAGSFNAILSLLSSVALAIILWQGGYLTLEGIFELGTLSVFMTYALSLMDPIQGLIQEFSYVISTQVNIERFDKMMRTQSDVVDSDEVVEKYGDTFHPKKENWEVLKGDVRFEDVNFQYPDGDELVLEHFNLDIPHGTNVAIVGETGAGKSTLVNLVCRFYEPTSGRVLIDGKDARDRSQLWLHSNIGYVLQTPQLFSGTIRENMRYGKPDASDEEIWAALKLVAADEVVLKLEEGLDSILSEGGGSLSTGEKQLISFARAIISDPSLLVLDEATASIDTLTEKKIQDAIATVIQGRTSFVIAHRLSTIVDADVILVFKDGKIIEQGKHKELMKQKGYYFSLYTRQFEEIAIQESLS